jgi:hypothetical protein
MSWACGCLGDLRLTLYDGSTQVAMMTIHGGESIRCAELCASDLVLTSRSAAKLAHTLVDLGINYCVDIEPYVSS